MHEYSITESIIGILKDVARKNDIERISKVNFEISPAASIEPESIRFYYNHMTENDELLKGARLAFSRSELEMCCTDCGDTFRGSRFRISCPGCGSKKVRLQESDDIRITSVET